MTTIETISKSEPTQAQVLALPGRLPIFAYAADPLSRAGLQGQLRFEPRLRLLSEEHVDVATIGVVAADSVDAPTIDVLRRLNRLGCSRIVLIVADLHDAGLVTAIDAGVCAVLRRAEASAEKIADLAGKVARGEAALPADLLARLLRSLSQLQSTVLAPRGLRLTGLSDREAAVLRLVADGMDTDEIARTLNYSSRTVKNILHDITTRFQLRNRSHAVAYALREGLI